MYIKKYWGNFIGGSDDSLNLVAFLEDQKKEEIPLSEIFAKIGLDKQNWNFRQTVDYLEFTHSSGVEMDFHFAIDVVTDLAAILLECSIRDVVVQSHKIHRPSADVHEEHRRLILHQLRMNSDGGVALGEQFHAFDFDFVAFPFEQEVDRLTIA